MQFVNREEAGKKLARALAEYKGSDAVVYALPRGGVVLGFEIAKSLKASLDLVITRKIGHPNSPEYAVCAIAENGGLICNEAECALLDPLWLKSAVEKELQEALRRRETYLKNAERISPKGKVAIIIDDGIATGLTIRAAVQSIRAQKPKKVVVAVPVASEEAVQLLRGEADEVIMLDDTEDFLGSVGAHYDDFPQVSDEEVINLLTRSRLVERAIE